MKGGRRGRTYDYRICGEAGEWKRQRRNRRWDKIKSEMGGENDNE